MSQTAEKKSVPFKLTSYQIIVIIILALTQFTVILDFMVMSPLGDMLMKTLNLTTRQFGFAVSAYAISAFVSGVTTAAFADRFDRKKLLLFFYIGFIAGTLFCGLATTYPLLLAARIVTGLFGGVIGSIAMAIVADLFLAEQRGRVVGFMQLGFGASQVLGIPISLMLAYTWNWQMPFLSIVGLASLILLAIIFFMKPIVEHLKIKADNPLKHWIKTIKNRNYRIGFLATSFLSIGGFMMMPWGSAFSINNLQVSPSQLTTLFMVSGVSALVTMPLMGRLSDKFDRFTMFAFASVWMIVMVVVYTNLTVVPFWVVLTLNIAFMVGIMSRMVPAMALGSMLPEMKDRGAYMSISASLQQLAGGIAAAAGGLIVVQKTKTSPLEHYDTLGYVIVVISIMSIFLISRVSKIVKAQSVRKTDAEVIASLNDSQAKSAPTIIPSPKIR